MFINEEPHIDQAEEVFADETTPSIFARLAQWIDSVVDHLCPTLPVAQATRRSSVGPYVTDHRQGTMDPEHIYRLYRAADTEVIINSYHTYKN